MSLIKFGWILLREGLIQRKQMENILNLQERHQDRLFGELAVHYFAVPEEEVEAVFANHVLLPFCRNWFLEQLTRRITITALEGRPFIVAVDLVLASFTRRIIRATTYTPGDRECVPVSGNVSLLVNGTFAEVVIRTAINESLIFADVQFDFVRERLEMTLVNPHLFTEAKMRLNQLHKKHAATQMP
ncbi:MAG: hypothetical protein ACOY32_04600 [Thermodesulfobacteriota bacterium]